MEFDAWLHHEKMYQVVSWVSRWNSACYSIRDLVLCFENPMFDLTEEREHSLNLWLQCKFPREDAWHQGSLSHPPNLARKGCQMATPCSPAKANWLLWFDFRVKEVSFSDYVSGLKQIPSRSCHLCHCYLSIKGSNIWNYLICQEYSTNWKAINWTKVENRGIWNWNFTDSF